MKLREPRAFVPPIGGEALAVYEAAIVRAWDRYAELATLLKDDAHAILKELRYVRPTTNPERLKLIDKDAEKRAIETARYVIPIGAFTSMVHTVSGIVLHRLHRMLNAGDVPYEAAMVIGAMVDAAVVMIENAHKHLEHEGHRVAAGGAAKPRTQIILEATTEVGPSLFFSLLVIADLLGVRLTLLQALHAPAPLLVR